MRKSFMRAALPTMAMLLVAIMTLTGVTFAWFTQGATASVQQFTVDVQAADGLLISPDYQSWGSYVQTSDIIKAQGGQCFLINASGSAGTMKPCSTAGSVDSTGNLMLFTADLTEKGDAIQGISQADEGCYVKFYLYVQNAGTGTKTVTVSPTFANGDNNQKSSVLAVRMAMIQAGAEATGVDILTTGNSATIFEPYADVHTKAGISDYSAFKAPSGGTVGSNAIFDYVGIAKAPTGSAGTYQRYTATSDGVMQTVTTIKGTSAEAGSVSFDLAGGSTAQVYFYFWVEGQDADCLNDIAGHPLTIGLSFVAENK